VLRPVETFFEESFRKRADATTVINSELLRRAVALGVDSERILVLPNGFHVNDAPVRASSEVRRRLGLPTESTLVFYVGAIFRRDAELMAAAFDRIYAARPNARLLLVGCRMPIEEYSAYPEAMIRVPHVSRDVVADYVAVSDLCWVPMRDSGANRGRFPVKVGEFLAAGKPVVTTDVGDVGSLLRNEEAGAVACDNPQDLADAVLRLLSDPERMSEMARRGQELAKDRYSLDLVGQTLETFYYKILGEN
jgi:glycosyltransferase involved in cell wall biosynthesis